MKTREELKNTYIEINGNEKLSRVVQEKLFAMGLMWIGVMGMKKNITQLLIILKRSI